MCTQLCTAFFIFRAGLSDTRIYCNRISEGLLYLTLYLTSGLLKTGSQASGPAVPIIEAALYKARTVFYLSNTGSSWVRILLRYRYTSEFYIETGIKLSKRPIQCLLIRFRKQETDVSGLSRHRKGKEKKPLPDRCERVQLIYLFIFLA
jgi:hypothetical protein